MNLLHSKSFRAPLFAILTLGPCSVTLAQRVSSDGNVVVQITQETVEPLASFPLALIRQAQTDRIFRPTRLAIFQNPVGGAFALNTDPKLWPSELNSLSGGARNYVEYAVTPKTSGPLTQEEAFFNKVFPDPKKPGQNHHYRLSWVQVVETNDGPPSLFIDPYRKDSRASSIIDFYPLYYDLNAVVCGQPQEKFSFFDEPRRELRKVTTAQPHIWWRAKLYPVLVNCDSGRDRGAITAIDNGKGWGFEMKKAPVGLVNGVFIAPPARMCPAHLCQGYGTPTFEYAGTQENAYLALYRQDPFDTLAATDFRFMRVEIHNGVANGPMQLLVRVTFFFTNARFADFTTDIQLDITHTPNSVINGVPDYYRMTLNGVSSNYLVLPESSTTTVDLIGRLQRVAGGSGNRTYELKLVGFANPTPPGTLSATPP